MNTLKRGIAGLALIIAGAAGCGGGGGCGSSCPPPPPTGRVTVTSAQVTTPAPIYAGDSASVTALSSAVEGATGPDSVVVANGNPRMVLGGSYTGKVPSVLGANRAPFTVYGKRSNGQPTSVDSAFNFTAQARPLPDYTLRVQLVDMDGNPVTTQHSMLIDDTPVASDANGLVSVTLPQGTHRIGYARRNANDTTATRLELPNTYANNVRVIFPRFRFTAGAAAGQDTLTLNSNVDARGVVAGLGANFNKEHHAGYFDDIIYGQQGIRGDTVKFHILTQAGTGNGVSACQTMSAGALTTWRQFQQNQVTELQGNYTVVNTEGPTQPSPAELASGKHVVLCQGPIVGSSIFRNTSGAFTFDVAYIGVNSPMGAADAEALLSPYGSSGTEAKCLVPSIFNDSNPLDEVCSLGAVAPTVYDRREGLDMMRDFARPANARAAVTNTFQQGTVKVYFSLRPN